jgi:hypothetical protein
MRIKEFVSAAIYFPKLYIFLLFAGAWIFKVLSHEIDLQNFDKIYITKPN